MIEAPVVRLHTLWSERFTTSTANPKAVVFFAALFPQCINDNLPIVGQIVIPGGTYLFIYLLTVCSWLFMEGVRTGLLIGSVALVEP